MGSLLPRTLVIFTLLLSVSALACLPEKEDCVEVGKWDLSLGIGLGLRTNPLVDGDNIPLVLVPQINYNGERFFIQNLDLGFMLWETDTHQLNLLVMPSYDQVFFDRWNPSNIFIENSTFAGTGGSKNPPSVTIEDPETPSRGGTNSPNSNPSSNPNLNPNSNPDFNLSNRRTAGLGGLEYNFATNFIDVQFHYLTDVTRVHSGNEARLLLTKKWQHNKHLWLMSVGGIWQSSEVVNYYYGLTQAEANELNTYATGSAISGLARVDWNYHLTEHWSLRLFASYRQLADEISTSPLIDEKSVVTVFFGGVYHF